MKVTNEENKDQNISRRDALGKAGKYALFTAAASLVILSPRQAQAASGDIDRPGGTWNNGPSGPSGSDSKSFKQSPWANDGLGQQSSSGLKNSPWK